jgi:hypothetical protein
LQPGLQTLRLETEDDETELFINTICPNDGPSYLKRLVHPLAENETLSFTYGRTYDEREFAILRIFRNVGESEPTRLRVRIVAERNDDNHGSLNWTDFDREVMIQPSARNAERSLSLDPSIAELDAGQPIFLRIGDDIVDQRLKIEVEYLEGPTGFVTLYQLKDKLEFDSQFTIESPNALPACRYKY